MRGRRAGNDGGAADGKIERNVLMEKFRDSSATRAAYRRGRGQGLSAKCEEAGGVDLIVIYNSGRYRMAGRGSLAGLLAYGDANAIVVEMAGEVLPVVERTPVLAGVNGTDPFRDMDVFLDEIKRLAYLPASRTSRPSASSTASSAPTSKRTGMGYALEVDMIARARARIC